MPRQIDHAARRRLVARAAFELVDEQGVEVATQRAIAARAGVSMGAVQRCFRTKAELMGFVLEYMGEQLTARVQATIDAAPASDSVLTKLEQILKGLTALDADSLAEGRVWLAFAAQALAHPELARIQKRQYEEIAKLIGLLLRASGDAGELAADVDVTRQTLTLMVLCDGLNFQLLFGRCSIVEARQTLEDAIAALRP